MTKGLLLTLLVMFVGLCVAEEPEDTLTAKAGEPSFVFEDCDHNDGYEPTGWLIDLGDCPDVTIRTDGDPNMKHCAETLTRHITLLRSLRPWGGGYTGIYEVHGVEVKVLMEYIPILEAMSCTDCEGTVKKICEGAGCKHKPSSVQVVKAPDGSTVCSGDCTGSLDCEKKVAFAICP